MKQEPLLLSALDVASSKTAMLICERNIDGSLTLIGFGEARTDGVERGNITNLEKVVKSIQKAVRDAETMANVRIDSVSTSVSGEHIRCIQSRGVHPIASGEKGEITREDVEKVIEAAQAVAVPSDSEIVDCIAQSFVVDGQEGIKDPIGMTAVRLEVDATVITAGKTQLENIRHSVARSELSVSDTFVGIEASSVATLTPEERDMGVAVVDIGAGLTQTAVFLGGKMKFIHIFGYAGNSVTKDIAAGCVLPFEQAEKLKLEHGDLLIPPDNQENIDIPGIAGREPRKIKKLFLGEIIEARFEEIFSFVKEALEKQNLYNKLITGIVLTGGSSQMPGIVPFAERFFGLPVRIGFPARLGGMSNLVNAPAYSSSVGTVLLSSSFAGEKQSASGKGEGERGLLGVLTKWLKKKF